MIDLAKIQYRVVVMDESKNQYNVKEYIENLGWEENDGELSVRTSFVEDNQAGVPGRSIRNRRRFPGRGSSTRVRGNVESG